MIEHVFFNAQFHLMSKIGSEMVRSLRKHRKEQEFHLYQDIELPCNLRKLMFSLERNVCYG